MRLPYARGKQVVGLQRGRPTRSGRPMNGRGASVTDACHVGSRVSTCGRRRRARQDAIDAWARASGAGLGMLPLAGRAGGTSTRPSWHPQGGSRI